MRYKIHLALFLIMIRASFALEMEIDDFCPFPTNDDQLDHIYNLAPSQDSPNYAWVIENSTTEELGMSDSVSLPRQADFSYTIPMIHSQGNLGSCTAQAITLAMESNLMQRGDYRSLSSLYVYYNARQLAGTIGKDSGTSLCDGIRAICETGACLEETWPYSDDKQKFKQKPPKYAYAEGQSYLDLDNIRHSYVPYHLNAVKYKLAQNIPVIFGIYVYPSFETRTVRETGKIPIPDQRECCKGRHALMFVGYDDDAQAFKFANSWGENWGDHGFGYLSYDYVMNKNAPATRPYFYTNDMWSIKQIGKKG